MGWPLRTWVTAGTLAGWLALASAVSAQDSYAFTVALWGGVGGAFDTPGKQELGESAYQVSLAMLTDDRTLTVARIGSIAFASDGAGSSNRDLRLEFVNLAGEYRFRQPAYDYGFFLGIGAYRVRDAPTNASGDGESALGLALGFTGDFDLSRHLSIVAELDYHYTFLDEFNSYGAALGGIAIHF